MNNTVLDLFSGCGGLSEGLEMAGLDVCFANDIWRPAADTYKLNHPDTRFVLGDIREVAVRNEIYKEFEDRDCDIIAGSPPCQSFSMAGLRDASDPRGQLYKDFLDIVETLQPKVVIMENVTGICSMIHMREPYWDLSKVSLDSVEPGSYDESLILAVTMEPVADKIVRLFSEMGYQIEYRTLDSSGYGVAQKRKRVVFVAVRNDLYIPEEFPDPITYGNEVTVRDAIGDLCDYPENKSWSHIFTRHHSNYIERIKKTPVGKSVNETFSESWYRTHPDKPAPTVKANNGGVFIHYEQDRCMTPRELARLQSFSDDYLFCGSKSDVLKQIGNAVPPLLGKAIGSCVKGMLDVIDDTVIGFPTVNELERVVA